MKKEQTKTKNRVKVCNACGRPTSFGFCLGCGEYASHSKCKCKQLGPDDMKLVWSGKYTEIKGV